MTIPTRTQLGFIKRGDVITANPFLNNIIDQLNRTLEDYKPPTQVEQALLEGEEPELPFMSCDLLLENEFDLLVLTPAGTLAFVAKPQALFGAIATRTVAGEAQEILPAYNVGDVIFAFRFIDGGTRVAGGTRGRVVIPEWQDMNVDARAWAESDA